MELLGRNINLGVSASGDATRFDMRDYGTVSLVVVGTATGTTTVSNHTAASSGTSTQLDVITNYWRQSGGTWTEVTQSAAATFASGTGGLVVAEIQSTEFDDDHRWISASCDNANAKIVFVFGDLAVQRSPENLADIQA